MGWEQDVSDSNNMASVRGIESAMSQLLAGALPLSDGLRKARYSVIFSVYGLEITLSLPGASPMRLNL
jgi:hypothetical protein